MSGAGGGPLVGGGGGGRLLGNPVTTPSDNTNTQHAKIPLTTHPLQWVEPQSLACTSYTTEYTTHPETGMPSDNQSCHIIISTQSYQGEVWEGMVGEEAGEGVVVGAAGDGMGPGRVAELEWGEAGLAASPVYYCMRKEAI